MLPCESDGPFPCLGGACKVEHPELSLHLLCFQAPLEFLQEVHHGRVSLKVSEVVVHPQKQDTGHLVTQLGVLTEKETIHYLFLKKQSYIFISV